jgi:hypothetical protein
LEVSDVPHVPGLFITREEGPSMLLNRRLDGLQSQLGHFEEKIKFS